MELSFLSGIDPGPLALWASMFAGGDPSGRISTVEAALKSRRGPYWRAEREVIGWLVPVEILVPDSAERWRPLVRDAFHLFERLSTTGSPPAGPAIRTCCGYPESACSAWSTKCPGCKKSTGARAQPPPGAQTAARSLRVGKTGCRGRRKRSAA